MPRQRRLDLRGDPDRLDVRHDLYACQLHYAVRLQWCRLHRSWALYWLAHHALAARSDHD